MIPDIVTNLLAVIFIVTTTVFTLRTMRENKSLQDELKKYRDN